ncbi:MAG: hypothetical protein ACRD0A_13300 [Acidimicrobiales bacterium]
MSEYGESSESGDQSSDEDEEVAIDLTAQADESIEVSMDDLLADGYQPEPDDDQYIA